VIKKDVAVSIQAAPSAPPGLIDVSAVWREPPKAPQSDFLCDPLIDAFVVLGRLGGLSGARGVPGRAGAVVEARQLGAQSHWRLVTAELDPGAIAVLHNILVFSHGIVSPLAQIGIHTSLLREGRLPPPLAGRGPSIPFAFEFDSESSEPQVCIELAVDPTPEQAEELKVLARAWQLVAAACGFQKDIWSEQKLRLFSDDDPEWLNEEFWIRPDDMACDERAFDSLCNALAGLHSRGVPIVNVRIE
jgi:hypothetical protein